MVTYFIKKNFVFGLILGSFSCLHGQKYEKIEFQYIRNFLLENLDINFKYYYAILFSSTVQLKYNDFDTRLKEFPFPIVLILGAVQGTIFPVIYCTLEMPLQLHGPI